MTTYKLIIAGSREFTAGRFLDATREAAEMFANVFPRFQEAASRGAVEVFSGACAGMDLHGEALAAERGWAARRFVPEWGRYGKRAGPLRNQAMIDAGADGCIVIRLDDSRGSADMERRADGEIDFMGLVLPRKHEGRTFDPRDGEWR